MDAFEGEVVIRRRRWASAESGFAVLDADCDGEELEGARIAGEWQHDPRLGLQVRVATAEPLPPSGEPALTAYLRRVKHVGTRRAERLLARWGDDVLEAIDRDPGTALRAAGGSRWRLDEGVPSWD